MQDKIVLITGGNAGIGKATAIQLARQGAQVCITSRSAEKGKKAVEEIKQKSNSEGIDFFVGDLSSFKSVRNLVKQFRDKYAALDVLINNAGIFTGTLQHTEEGFEMQFGVNHLGHFLLTKLLIPSLQQANAPRIVNVSSVAYMHGKIDFDNLRGEKEDYSAIKAYARSKLANVLFTREFSRRFKGITANSLHPGVVRTYLANKDSKWYVSLFWTLYKPFMCTPEKGASTSVYLATAERLEGVTGQFFDEKQCRRNLVSRGRDQAMATRLWEYSEAAVAAY